MGITKRSLIGLLAGLMIVAGPGCGDGSSQPKQLTSEQEQQFKAQQSAAREQEGRARE